MSDDYLELRGWSTHIRRQWVLFSCPDCKALVLEEHILAHEIWHEQQEREEV